MRGKRNHDDVLAFLLALVVLGRWDPLKRALRKAAKDRVPFHQIRELLLQSHLFAGFPRSLEAFEVLASVQASGVFPADKNQKAKSSEGNRMKHEKRGLRLFEKIYASKSNEVLERIESFHPDLKKWILQHAYGRILSRPQLSAKQRELAAVAALTVSRQYRQLFSHLRGAVRCGAKPAEIRAVLLRLKPIIPSPVMKKAFRLFQQLQVPG